MDSPIEIVEEVENYVFRNKNLIKNWIVSASDIYQIGETFKKHGYEKNWLIENKYYQYLLMYVQIYKPRNILEIGTQTGAACACFLFSETNITTMDVNKTHVSEEILEMVNFINCEKPESCLDVDYSKFDFIFVDGGHDGVIELKIHEKLVKDKYKGIVFWDDISLDQRMKNFWSQIKEKKAETHWHDECGFGIVRYG